jgi:hypothetical protein
MWLSLVSALALTSCSPSGRTSSDRTQAPNTADVVSGDFVDVVDNPSFPLTRGSRHVYESQTRDGLERTEVEVLAEACQVMGIPATVARNTVCLDGETIEDTFDWYAQHSRGNVWYLGEDVSNYQSGELADTTGSREAGMDGALPGIIMYEDHGAHLGETYCQGCYPGVAQDMADLLGVAETATVPFGSFIEVVQISDYTPLETGVEEHKYCAAGIGLIREVNPDTGEEAVLIEFA